MTFRGTAPLTVLAIKRELFRNFAKAFKGCHLMKVSIAIDL